MPAENLKAPFPYFGGKSRVAEEVWARFGAVKAYVEPFFGSGAVLLGRPQPFNGLETVNDKDHFIANFWRALRADPEGLARACDWPINETDLHARHVWLVNEGVNRIRRCYDKADHYDIQTAAWWVWGLSQWIGGGWCQQKETWHQRPAIGGKKGARGVNAVPNGRPHLARPSGINATGIAGGGGRVEQSSGRTKNGNHFTTHLPNARVSRGFRTPGSIPKKRPSLAPHKELGHQAGLIEWFQNLSERLRNVRVVCGDWKRVTGPSVTVYTGICGMFLDPPYTKRTGRDQGLYRTDSGSVGDEVHKWAVKHGENPQFRIAVCGYEGEYDFPNSWKVFVWKTEGGFGKIVRKGNPTGVKNAERERIWFSPHCLEPQPSLF